MIKVLVRFGIFVMASFLAIGFAHSADNLEPRTVDSVDLKQYQGTWYEIAQIGRAHV